MAVLHPLKLVLTNYPEDRVEHVDVPNNPEDPNAGTRQVPLSREVYIDREDFAEVPPQGWRRFTLNAEVRLTNAFCVICTELVKDAQGKVTELRGTFDDATRHGKNPEGRPKVKAAVHWVSARHAVNAEVRLYDRLFTVDDPDAAAGEDGDFTQFISKDSLALVSEAKLEPSLAEAGPGQHYQFVRVGYFFTDPQDSKPDKPVFNRVVSLRDGFAKK